MVLFSDMSVLDLIETVCALGKWVVRKTSEDDCYVN
jgi:hypothetical protein